MNFSFHTPGFYRKPGYTDAFALKEYPYTGAGYSFTKALKRSIPIKKHFSVLLVRFLSWIDPCKNLRDSPLGLSLCFFDFKNQ